MSHVDSTATTQSIVVDEFFPYAPARIWAALTDPRQMGRWLMQPTGFEPVVGNRFTYQTKPAGEWDGTIRCEVLEVVPQQRFVHAWRGGHESNVGYGSRLDTVVTWTLTPEGGGTRVRMVHSGFELPRNQTAYDGMSGGWRKVVPGLREHIGTQD